MDTLFGRFTHHHTFFRLLECEDKKERCSDWKNFCQSRNIRQKNYMKKYCSKTCKFCGRGGSGGGGGQRGNASQVVLLYRREVGQISDKYCEQKVKGL